VIPEIGFMIAAQTHLLEYQQQYEREVADLVLDGWIVDA
jgi:hypothetical protein